ncbi:helix-turn-helix transcriptional regulator [Lysinibacillus sp.]|uniref:helix-turn-helix domain-containing protein n=1 Tax=Lysinibacillus sp. TaxID=1869345 RepID=UPI0028A071E4|nr:helix-turn-helix transcriptional regulator [Lysinibacillus sp.]
MNSKKPDIRKQFSTILADYLYQLRHNQKLALADVAAETDMSPQVIGLYEKGKRIPSVDAMSKLAKFYNVDKENALQVREDAIIETTQMLGEDTPPAIKNEYVMLSLRNQQITIDGKPLTSEELEKATEFIKALRQKQNKFS